MLFAVFNHRRRAKKLKLTRTIKPEFKDLAQTWEWKKRCIRDPQVRMAADPVVGFGGRKAPSSMGNLSTAEVLRLRATSAVSRDQSVRRSAQDDDFVGVLTKNIPDKLALMGRSPNDRIC